jgi:hydrogenase expression/formation protein HypE
MKLPSGKIPIDLLEEVIFKNLGARRSGVAVGPSAGIDGTVIDVGDKSIVVSTDPITGAVERIGWLAVNINANDVATFGVEPAFFLSSIMLPRNASRKTVETISIQMSEAAENLGIAIVGGHCEVTPGLVNPIVAGCIVGITEKGKYVTAANAKAGDRLILTKSAGIEGTAILASDREDQLKNVLDREMLQNAKEFYRQISVVKDALTAFKTGGVNAMHDPTEGGISGGIFEMAKASSLGVKVLEEKVQVQPETAKMCEFFQINPLQLISSGALLISAKPKYADEIIANLKKRRIHASVIGEFVKDQKERKIVKKTGEVKTLSKPASDHLWIALKRRPI